jgi:hypothetical protein
VGSYAADAGRWSDHHLAGDYSFVDFDQLSGWFSGFSFIIALQIGQIGGPPQSSHTRVTHAL